MERHLIAVTIDGKVAEPTDAVWASIELLSQLGLCDGQTCALRFGGAIETATFQASSSLSTGELRLSAALADRLHLQSPLTLTVYRAAPAQVVLGPLVGLLISAPKLEAVLNGKQDRVYCRYSRAGREAGAILFFFAAEGIDLTQGRIDGYLHDCDASAGCRWQPLRVPLPRVIYDRSFGRAARTMAAELRSALEGRGVLILNRPVKITKLQAFRVLQPYVELAPHLPFTAPFSLESLEHLVDLYPDLYVKPDSLYKGKGVCRLMRQVAGWLLQSREDWGNQTLQIREMGDLVKTLAAALESGLQYVVQEGLPLATYLGNRFDLRSLVQRNGEGNWQVSGVVARIAPEGSVITSPRSGGQTAPIHRVLRHAFAERASAVSAEIDRVSLMIAERIDRHLGPCAELGLDLGVLQDGTVKLIEVNGIPLRVSLERLRDPLVGERIDRYPVHYAAYLDTLE